MSEEIVRQLRRAGAVALDTVLFIYAFERHPVYGPIAQAVFRALEAGEYQGCVSVLALGEVLVGAKRAGDERLALQYSALFRHFPHLTTVDVDRAVVERASDLRARYGVSMPDAIHLGAALVWGARAFVTNDAGLKRVGELEILLLSEFT